MTAALRDRVALWAALGAALIAALTGFAIRYSSLLLLPLAAGLAFVLSPAPTFSAMLLVREIQPESILVTFVFLVGGLAYLAVYGSNPVPRMVLWPLLAFLTAAVLTVPKSPAPWDSTVAMTLPVTGDAFMPFIGYEVLDLLRLLLLPVVLCVAASTTRTIRDLDRLLIVLLVGAALVVLVCLWQLATGATVTRDGTQSIRATFSHPAALGLYLVVAIGVAAGAVASGRGSRWLAWFVIAAGAVCLYFTYTRSAWAGGVLIFVVFAAARYRWLAVGAGIAVVLLMAFPSSPASTGFDQRLSDRSSWEWRTRQWDRMFDHALGRPVVGRGFGTYERNTLVLFGFNNAFYNTRPVDGWKRGFSAHNDYLKSFLELGVVGLAAWVLFLVGLIRWSWSQRHVSEVGQLALACFAISLALALMGATDNVQGYAVNYVIVLAVIGGLVGVTRSARA